MTVPCQQIRLVACVLCTPLPLPRARAPRLNSTCYRVIAYQLGQIGRAQVNLQGSRLVQLCIVGRGSLLVHFTMLVLGDHSTMGHLLHPMWLMFRCIPQVVVTR